MFNMSKLWLWIRVWCSKSYNVQVRLSSGAMPSLGYSLFSEMYLWGIHVRPTMVTMESKSKVQKAPSRSRASGGIRSGGMRGAKEVEMCQDLVWTSHQKATKFLGTNVFSDGSLGWLMVPSLLNMFIKVPNTKTFGISSAKRKLHFLI